MKDKKYSSIIIWGIIILGIFTPVFLIIVIGIKEGKCPFLVDYNTDHWVGIFGGVLGYIGTMTLGIVTILQNNRSTSIAEESLQLTKESLERELKLKIPDIEVKFFSNEKMKETLFKGDCYYNDNDYGCDVSVNATYQEDENFMQYGYFPLIIFLQSKDKIKDFRLEQISIHNLSEKVWFRFKPSLFQPFDLNKEDNIKTYAVKICASTKNNEIKNIFSGAVDFQFTFRFSFYNILDKRLELEQSGCYYNKNLMLLGNSKFKYKEEPQNGQTQNANSK